MGTNRLGEVRKAVTLLAGAAAVALAMGEGDHRWNFRDNGDDRFHSNEAWLRPWRSSSEDGWGRWVGGYSYELAWGSTRLAGDSSGRLSFHGAQDMQFHAWTYVFVETAKTININGTGDCVPRAFVNYAFDAPRFPYDPLSLVAGWNRIDLTGYNQNDPYGFSTSAVANLVDFMNREIISLQPTAAFAVSPRYGWSGKTAFEFLDTSTNLPSSWSWDLDGDGSEDHSTQNVPDQRFTAPAGGEASYPASLRVERFGFSDEMSMANAVTVFGSPVASFDWAREGFTVTFSNTSEEPGLLELGGYVRSWDLDGDGDFDDMVGSGGSWTYSVAGDYLVRLQVENGSGIDIAEALISVPEPVASAWIAAACGLAIALQRRVRQR